MLEFLGKAQFPALFTKYRDSFLANQSKPMNLLSLQQGHKEPVHAALFRQFVGIGAESDTF